MSATELYVIGTLDQILEQAKVDGTSPEETLKTLAVKLDLDLQEHIEKTIETFEKRRGTLPGFIKEKVQLRRNVRLPWTSLLKSHLMTGITSIRKRTFRRLNRRTATSPSLCPYPGRIREHVFRICNIIDTSGSMSNRAIEKGLDVNISLLKYNPKLEVYVAYADTQVHKYFRVRSKKDIDFTVLGRGGTDFIAPINFCLKEIKPDILIYFTDTQGTAPSKAPSIPIIWVTTEENRPYGENGSPINYGKFICVQVT